MRTIPEQLPQWIASQRATNPEGCWRWPWAINSRGYGHLHVPGSGHRGHHVNAHRLVYEQEVGPIAPGMELDHLCARWPGGIGRSCVNPAHLEPVSTRENLLRGNGASAQNARKTHCAKGHPFDDSNTGHDSGGRRCRACAATRQRERRVRLGDAIREYDRRRAQRRREADPDGEREKDRAERERAWAKSGRGRIKAFGPKLALRVY